MKNQNSKHKIPNTKSSKGITLVALIITIIVLLILAVVAIGAVNNTGIINYADNSVDTYKAGRDNETAILQSYVDYLNENNPTKKEENNIPDELAKYILGADGEGRDLFGILDAEAMTFQQDPADEESTIHTKIKFSNFPEESSTIYLRYNRDVYKFDFSYSENEETGDEEYKTVKDSLTLVNTPTGNLGKYVRYKGIDWIVFREDNEKVELISANGLGEFKFEQTDFETARTNYNNVVETLVNACKTATGISTDIRNVGGPASEDVVDDENTVVFNELEFTKSVSIEEFTQYEGATNGLRKGDKNYVSDYEQMEALGILATDTLAYYYLASREVWVNGTYGIEFSIRHIDTYGNLGGSGLLAIRHDAVADCHNFNKSSMIRPVIILESGIIHNATQTGLINDPIVID